MTEIESAKARAEASFNCQRICEIAKTERGDAENDDDATGCVDPAENEAVGWCGSKIT